MKISIRNSKFAIIGLKDLIFYMAFTSGRSTKEMSMVEVGSYVGDSTKIFAEAFGRVISVDPYLNGYDNKDSSSYIHPMPVIEKQFREEVLNCFSNVQLIKQASKEGSLKFEDGSLDFVYLDGNHTDKFVREDVELWSPKIKKGGFIGGHDYENKNAPEVRDAVTSILGTPDKLFRDTSWIKRI
jgi:predicted O-methyltransferase YrrM